MTVRENLHKFPEDSNIKRRAFLRSFIESIESVEVDNGQLTLNYTVPLPWDKSRQESVSVPAIVPSSPPEVLKEWIIGRYFL